MPHINLFALSLGKTFFLSGGKSQLLGSFCQIVKSPRLCLYNDLCRMLVLKLKDDTGEVYLKCKIHNVLSDFVPENNYYHIQELFCYVISVPSAKD